MCQEPCNDKPIELPVYSGMNGDLILYFIRQDKQMLCVEATTGFIGYTPEKDIVVKKSGILVDPASVPPAAKDAKLKVEKASKGYRLTIAREKDVLVCEAPAPVDPYQMLLAMPKKSGERKAIHKSLFALMNQKFEEMEQKADEATPDPPPGPANAGRAPGAAAATSSCRPRSMTPASSSRACCARS